MALEANADLKVSEEINKNLNLERLNSLVPNEALYREAVPRLSTPSEAFCLLAFYQAARLAALLHDIGHPPYSHVVEYALEEAMGHDLYPGHEQIGRDLFQIVCHDTVGSSQHIVENYRFFVRCVVQLASVLLDSREHGIFHGMYRTLYSGEVDADRLDYVRRDIFSTGIATTTYDLGRILDSCYLRNNKEQIELGLDTGCLSALEVFFGARFHLYRWVIYHHDVVRRNLAVQRFILTLMSSDDSNSTKSVLLLRDGFRKKAEGGKNFDEYYTFVDGNFIDLIWNVYSDIQRRMPDCNQREKDLHLFASVIIQRDNGRLRSLWKRPDDYDRFCKSLLEGKDDKTRRAVAVVNERLRNAYQPIASSVPSGIARLRFGMKLEEEVRKHLSGDHRVFVYYIGGFRAAPEESFYLCSKGRTDPTYIDDVSPTLSALRTAWEQCPQMMLFYELSESTRFLNTQALNGHYSEAVRRGLQGWKFEGSN
jgi:hypothetical protein